MFLSIDHPERDLCQRCRSNLARAGYVVEDDQGVRQFVCISHLVELLHSFLPPAPAYRGPRRNAAAMSISHEIAVSDIDLFDQAATRVRDDD